MKIIEVDFWGEQPDNFTGIAIWRDGEAKVWLREGNLHRLDGPAIEWNNGEKSYWIFNQDLSKAEFDLFQFLWDNTFLKQTDKLIEIFVELAKTEQQ